MNTIKNEPKALMISRYEAFVNMDWQYLVDTSLYQTLQELQNQNPIEWLKLDIIENYDNFVEFKAYFRENGKVGVLHEKSRFTQIEGVWKYDDGILFHSKIERNEICPCGSGKKFKKCCA